MQRLLCERHSVYIRAVLPPWERIGPSNAEAAKRQDLQREIDKLRNEIKIMQFNSQEQQLMLRELVYGPLSDRGLERIVRWLEPPWEQAAKK